MLKKKRGVLAGVLSLAMIAAVVAGCSSKSDEGAAGDGKSEVKIAWRFSGENDITSKYLEQDFIPQFEQAHPDIKILLSPITASEGDYYSKIALSMQSADTTPDIIAEDTFMLNADANAGYLTELDDYVKDWPEWSKYTENLKAGSTAQDGKLYAIPGSSDSRGLWYNKNLLQKAGLSAEWQPKTWQDILDAAQKIKETSPNAIPLGLTVAKANGEAVSMQTFEMLLYGTNDSLYDSTTKKWNINTQGILDSLNFIDQVYNQQKLGPPLSVAINSNFGSVMFQDKFVKDEAGIILDGFWSSSNWKATGPAPVENMTERFGFAAMPTQNGQEPGTVTMSGGWTWAIPAKSKHKDAAWEVIKALGGEEQQAKRAIADGNLTVRQDSAENADYKAQPFIEQATAFLKNAHFRPADDKYPNVSVEIQNMVEAVATGGKTPEAAAEDYAKNVTRIVGEENVSQ